MVCGAKEEQDEAGFQKVNLIGLTFSRMKEIEGKVLADCRNKVDPPIIPLTEELNTADDSRRIIIFVVPASNAAHCFRSGGTETSKYFIRVGRDTREARNGLLRELLTRKGILEPFDRRMNSTSNIEDIDPLALRDFLFRAGLWDRSKGLEDYLSPKERISDFVPPLVDKEKMTGVLRPRNFALLLFQRQPTPSFPGAYCVFSLYAGKDRSVPTAEKLDITGTVAEQATKLLERLNVETGIVFDKTDPRPNQVKYPPRAVQEAVINAIVHRDYESEQPIRVTVFSDRIEINSPGELPRAVDKDRFVKGQASPYWRNQSLAYFFSKLQLAQAEGQGIPTILRTMKEEGCPTPQFILGSNSVVYILPAHPRHETMATLRKIENDVVLQNYPQAITDLEVLLESDPHNFRALELYCEACSMAGTPERILSFLKKTNGVNFEAINASTKIILAETLLDVKMPAATHLANALLKQAQSGNLERDEVKRVAVSLRKMGNDEKAIEFLDNAMTRKSSLREDSTLLDIRAKAKIDLAKKCMDTAKMKYVGPGRRPFPPIIARAWEQCRSYLASAEKDLTLALQHVSNPVEREYIIKARDFLETMKTMAKKPQRK